MKKAIAVLLVVLSMAFLFAVSWTQTIVLMSVVEGLKPEYSLDVVYVENGYTDRFSMDNVLVHSHDVSRDVVVNLCINQGTSRYTGETKITILVDELTWDNHHTSGLEISAQTCSMIGRQSTITRSGDNILEIHNYYNGKAIGNSSVTDIQVRYQGNKNLPQGDYVSQIRMVVESN